MAGYFNFALCDNVKNMYMAGVGQGLAPAVVARLQYSVVMATMPLDYRDILQWQPCRAGACSRRQYTKFGAGNGGRSTERGNNT